MTYSNPGPARPSALPVRAQHALGALSLALACTVAHADPNDYVLTLDFEKGEREFDAKLGAASHAPNGTPSAQAAAISWGAGLQEYWFSEWYLQYTNKVDGTSNGISSASWENRFRFTEEGELPFQLGAVLELEKERVMSQGWNITFGPLVQWDIDRFQFNANALFTRQYGATHDLNAQFGYQYQVKYRYRPEFEFGMQGFGDVGKWDSWGDPGPQSHRLGPAVFGEFRLGGGRTFGYNTAFLMGTSSGAPNYTVRAQLEIEY